MLEQLVDGPVSPLQCQEIAKRASPTKIEFDLVGPEGKIRCRWLDPFLGLLFLGDGEEACSRIMDLAFASPPLTCENIVPAVPEEVPE